MAPLSKGHVLLRDAFGGAHRVEVEIAATHGARSRGMMWRKSLEDGKGMLFVFPVEESHGFWMQNTLISLDMIFISKDLKVVGIVHSAEPRSLVSRSGPTPSLYVLEVPGGWASRQSIKIGTEAVFEGVDSVPVR
jgi:uncharacterized membrane protein (UPF0127 family)